MKHIYVATIVLALAFLSAFGGQSVADDQPDCHNNKGAQIGQGHTRDDSKNHQGKGKGHHKCETPKPTKSPQATKSPSPTSSPQVTQSPAPTASPKASATPAGTATPTPKETSGGNTTVPIQRLPSTSTQ